MYYIVCIIYSFILFLSGISLGSKYFSPSNLHDNQFNKTKCIEKKIGHTKIKKCYMIVEVRF